MSTITTSQPFITVSAVAPRTPAFGLTSSPGAAVPIDSDRWEGGAWVEPFPPALPSAHDPCSEGTDRLKAIPEEYEQPNPFPGFPVYLGEICTTWSIGDWETWKARAESALEARTSWALERQLAWATFVDSLSDPVPHLSDAAADLPAGASAVPYRTAVSWADAYLAELGEQGVVHLPPPVVTALGFDFFRLSGGTLYTPAGNAVIVGAGYYGSTADDLDPAASGAAEAAAGQSWIFASGLVQYRVGELYAIPEDRSQAIERGSNTVVYRAERDLWVGFDGGRHAAILADWTP
jgi:hypothetical protein